MPRGVPNFRVFGDHAWMSRAQCARPPGSKVDFFGAGLGKHQQAAITAEAKAVCSGCCVRAECLDYALAADERHGIWGGMTPEERQEIMVD